MRPGFRPRLERFNQQIIDLQEAQVNENNAQIDLIESAIEYELKDAARKRGNAPEIQGGIFDIQAEKQAIMQELRRRLKAIDKLKTRDFEPYKERSENSRDVIVISGQMQVLEQGGWRPITLGELLTDGEWGIDFILDDRTVPREVHKHYVVEEAKRKLQNLLDRQILIDEISSDRTENGKKKAYEAYAENTLLRDVENRSGGMIAELLFQNLLKKISIDLGGEFEIIPADVFQDINQKVDFIIRRKMRGRGVRVEALDEGSTDSSSDQIGIQLTLQQNPDILRHKANQIKSAKKRMHDGELTDIVLVSVQTTSIHSLLREWVDKGRPHGGPDSLWDTQTKQRFLKTILEGVLDEETLKRIISSLDEHSE